MTTISSETMRTLVWAMVLFPVPVWFGLLFGNPQISSNLVLIFIGILLGSGFFSDALYGMAPSAFIMLIGLVLEFLWVLLWVMIIRFVSRKLLRVAHG